MRMWMLPPAEMCDQHLLGEHVELHMLVGHLRRGRTVTGFAAKNCLEYRSIKPRHAAIAAEMTRRGMRHASPLAEPIPTRGCAGSRVDVDAARADLRGRCARCAGRVR